MKYDQELVEFFQDYCAHHEAVYNFSPLTAQIYTYIMFNNNSDGVTFDEIVEKLNASKSSVSTSLNLLISNSQIEHFNKIDERKRYFKLNPDYLTIRLELIKDKLDREKTLNTRMVGYLNAGKLKSNNCEGKMMFFSEHLDSSIDNLATIIQKLKNSI